MKTLKTIGASFLAVFVVLGMACILIGGVLVLMAQDGVKWLRRQGGALLSRDKSARLGPVLVPRRQFQHVAVKIFSGPVGMVMDADGFVEPPATRGPFLLACPEPTPAPVPSRWDSSRASRSYETGILTDTQPVHYEKAKGNQGSAIADHKGFRIVGGKDLEASRIAATAHATTAVDRTGTLAFPTDRAERDRRKAERDARTAASEPTLPANVVRMTDFKPKKKV